MTAIAPRVLHFIAGEGQRAFPSLIGHPPIAGIKIEVVRTILHEDPVGFRLVLSNQRRIAHATPEIDVSANRAEHSRESRGPFPGGGESCDGAAAFSANRTVV